MVDGITTVVFPSETERSFLSQPRVVGKRTQSDVRGSPLFPKTSSTLCTDSCVLYLKWQGGTKVPWLTYLTWQLFHLCMDHNIQLVAVHLAGKLNSLSDQLSKATRPVATEWALNSHVFRAITQKWGEPGIDLFATGLNKQLPAYVSPCPDPQAFDTNALSMDWDILPFPYLSPTSPILLVVLQKVKQADNTFLVIALLWPHQPWYHSPWIIPCVSHRGKFFWFRTFPRGFGFTPTWVCSNTMLGCCPGAPPNSRFFGEHWGPDCLASERLHMTPLQCQVGRFLSWCHRRKADHVTANVPLVAEFMDIDTIRGYRSEYSYTLYNMVDLTNSVFMRNLLKNMDLQCPKYKELCPKWNLALVLAYITSPPFEPIMKASLWHLTLKTVFLFKLASG